MKDKTAAQLLKHLLKLFVLQRLLYFKSGGSNRVHESVCERERPLSSSCPEPSFQGWEMTLEIT